MLPKAVQDAGYTAVGLGVLAIQEFQIRRRATKALIGSSLDGTKAFVGAVAGQAVKVPLLAVAPVCGALGTGRCLLGRVLNRDPGAN